MLTSNVEQSRKMLSVFNYLDYREYLKDFYNFKKNERPGYSYRVFAAKAQLSSPNYLKLVIDSDRRITDKQLPAFVRGLGLSAEEAKYFRLIVLFKETTDLFERRDLLNKIITLRNRKVNKPDSVAKHQEEVLRHWSHWVIREMVQLNGFRDDPDWIANLLKNEITPQQARQSLNLLFDAGLIKRAKGRLEPASATISTEDEVANCLVRDLHAQMIEQGVKSLFRDPIHEREFAGLTIALSADQIPKFKEKLKQFRKDMNSEFSNQDGKRDQVYHLEMMFYPVSKGDEK